MGRLWFVVLLAAGLSGLLSGCATTGSQRVYREATSLQRLESALDEGSKALSETVSALAVLMVADPGNAEEAADGYLEAFRRLERRANRVTARAEALEQSAEREFRQWEVEMAASRGARIDSMSDGRRAAVNEVFRAIQDNLSETREAFEPLMVELRTLVTAIKDEDAAEVSPVDLASERFGEVNRLSSEVSARIAATMDAIFEGERLWSGR